MKNKLRIIYEAILNTTKFKRGTKEMAAATKKAEKAIESLDRDIKNVDKSTDKAAGSMKRFSGVLKRVGSALKSFGSQALAAFAIYDIVRSVIGAMKDFAISVSEAGKKVEGIKTAFYGLSEPITLLEDMRKQTKGLMSDLDLMTAGVKFSKFKLPIKDVGKMLEFVILRTQQTGKSFDYLYNSMVEGLTRNSYRLLDNLAMSQNELRKLTKETGSIYNAVVTVVDRELEESGGIVETYATMIMRLTAAFENLKVKMFEAFKLSGLLEPLIGLLDDLSGEMDSIEKVNLAVKFRELAEEVKGAYKALKDVANMISELSGISIAIEFMTNYATALGKAAKMFGMLTTTTKKWAGWLKNALLNINPVISALRIFNFESKIFKDIVSAVEAPMTADNKGSLADIKTFEKMMKPLMENKRTLANLEKVEKELVRYILGLKELEEGGVVGEDALARVKSYIEALKLLIKDYNKTLNSKKKDDTFITTASDKAKIAEERRKEASKLADNFQTAYYLAMNERDKELSKANAKNKYAIITSYNNALLALGDKYYGEALENAKEWYGKDSAEYAAVEKAKTKFLIDEEKKRLTLVKRTTSEVMNEYRKDVRGIGKRSSAEASMSITPSGSKELDSLLKRNIEAGIKYGKVLARIAELPAEISAAEKKELEDDAYADYLKNKAAVYNDTMNFIVEQNNEYLDSLQTMRESVSEAFADMTQSIASLAGDESAIGKTVKGLYAIGKGMADLTKNVNAFKEAKAKAAQASKLAAAAEQSAGISQVNSNMGVAASNAAKDVSGIPFGWLAIPAIIATVLGMFASIKGLFKKDKFAMGGIVPGTSFSGDNQLAMVNSGEMILNRSQQSELFRIANGAGGTGGNVEFEIRGDKLVGVLNNYNRKRVKTR